MPKWDEDSPQLRENLARVLKKIARNAEWREIPTVEWARIWQRSFMELAAVIDLCAWAHAEWIRIHPFANGNGRTARLWANSLAMRYSLPPFVRLRPRPNPGYAEAGAKAMEGDWRPTATVFQRLLDDFSAAGDFLDEE